MSSRLLLFKLHRRGATLSLVSDGQIQIDALRGALTADALTAIKGRKAEIVAHLSRRCGQCGAPLRRYARGGWFVEVCTRDAWHFRRESNIAVLVEEAKR